jgi:hypothetical protein
MNGTVAGALIAPAVAPAVGNAVAVHALAGPTGTNHVSLDVTCTVTTATRAGVVTSTHQTHWVGTI